MNQVEDLTGKTFNNWLILSLSHKKDKVYFYNCKCSCGNIHIVSRNALIHNRSRQCTKCARRARFIDLTGMVFHKWKVIKLDPTTECISDKKWICKCECGFVKSVLGGTLKQGASRMCLICSAKSRTRSYREISEGERFGKLQILQYLKSGLFLCKCDCGDQSEYRGYRLFRNMQDRCVKCTRLKNSYEEIRKSYWEQIIRSAKDRNLDFSIDQEYVWELYLKQNKKCVFTGIDLFFSNNSITSNSNLSLDRIDSSEGYIKNNVQWIYKPLNTMKMNLSQKEFIKLCKMVAKYNENND